MSNQVGLMLSFVFLLLFMVFANEVFLYQRFMGNMNSALTNISYSIQKDGKVQTTLNYYRDKYQLEYVGAGSTIEGNTEIFTLTIKDTYTTKSSLYSFIGGEKIMQVKIYRKE